MSVVAYNTLGKKKEELLPRVPGKISMYVCGPTVYNHIHVGNARAAIVFDVVRRYLVWRGFEVTYVSNYTDVDDKIIAKAVEEGRDPDAVAKDYADAFEALMRTLQISPPDILVKATDHIPDMIDLIGRLIDRGYAYESGGSVWYSVERFDGYGKLSGRSLKDVRAGERVEPDPAKRDPLDFALWKAAKPDEPWWESPWGNGRPGWHIECSAMSLKHLGMGFDIHGAGADLIFPHHENEIAQSEAATGEAPFVRYWLHNGMVNIDQMKMSKSLGNFVFLKDLLQRIPPQVVRLMAIMAHYRSDVDFGDAQLAEAQRVFERLSIFASELGADGEAEGSAEGKQFAESFRDAMDDDFNTPEALSVVFDLMKRGNLLLSDGTRAEIEGLRDVFFELTGVLGIAPGSPAVTDPLVAGLVELLISVRETARDGGRYEEADDIRARLADLGVVLEDMAEGTRWRTSGLPHK